MLKKSLLYTLLLLIINSELKAQKFAHAVGSTTSIMWAKLNTSYFEETVVLTHSDVTYFPRIILVETGTNSLSLGIPVGAGIAIIEEEYSGDATFFWSYDVQAVADFNFGAGATRNNGKKFGWYLGGGYGYTKTNWEYDITNGYKAKSYGPIARAGIRVGFPSSNFGLTAGWDFKFGNEREKFKTIGVRVLIDF